MLNNVQPFLRDSKSPGHLSRRAEIVLFHLCMQHTCLTHSYLMNGEDVPRCVACLCDLTMENVLIEGGDVAEIRQRHYDAENVQQLVGEINVTYVFDFLCKIGLFYRI